VGHVYVANHTSMIDYIVLTAVTPFSAIAQQNKGYGEENMCGATSSTTFDSV